MAYGQDPDTECSRARGPFLVNGLREAEHGKGGLRVESITLQRVLKREAAGVVGELLEAMGSGLCVLSPEGAALVGEAGSLGSKRVPVLLEGRPLGWVCGDPGAGAVASLLGLLARFAQERRALARETLEKYKEIHLFYRMSERMAERLDVSGVAELVLEEARRTIPATGGSVMLMDLESLDLKIVAGFGGGQAPRTALRPGVGIAGHVLVSGRAEVINHVPSDPRFQPGRGSGMALMCVPLRCKDRVRGVINMSHQEGVEYRAADLQLLTALASQASSAIENALLHERKVRQERIRGHLERYVPSPVIDLILKDPEHVSLASENRHIAVLFSDIRDFSTTCEHLAPEEVVGYLNRYFSAMVEEVFLNQGTVNKFVGDMIVALFGAPVQMERPEQSAVRAAVSMQERLQRMEDPWVRNHFPTGMGLSAGRVVVGNIGSPQHMDYTAIGDEVNVAARLQSAARGGQVLVSRKVREAAGDGFRFRAMGRIRVKGRQRPVEAYEVVY